MVPAPIEIRSKAAERRMQLGIRWTDVGGAVALGIAGVLIVGWSPALLGVLYLAAVSPALTRIDLAEHRLPNRLVLPGYAAATVTVLLSWVSTGLVPLAALAAGAAYFAFLLLLNLAGGMGMGDVKLGGVLGLILGTISVDAAVLGPLMAFLSGGLVAVLLLLIRQGSGTRMPFGPFLLLGFWGALALS